MLQIVQALQKRTVIGTFDWEKGGMEDDDDTDGGSEDAQPLGSDGGDMKPNSRSYEDQVQRLGPGSRFRPLA